MVKYLHRGEPLKILKATNLKKTCAADLGHNLREIIDTVGCL